MRFKRPKEWMAREVTKFLFLPKTLLVYDRDGKSKGEETRWLERATISQCNYGCFSIFGLPIWHSIAFIDETQC